MRERKNLGENSTVAQQSSQYGKLTKCGIGQIGREVCQWADSREGGMKQASAVIFPHSFVQGHEESFAGTIFRTFPIAEA